MFRVSTVKLSKFVFSQNVSKHSQKLFFSSKNVISSPPVSHQLWTASSEGDLILLKAKQNFVLAGMKERHELEIKHFKEKQELLLQFLEENHVVQLRKESNKQECQTESIEVGTGAVPMESPPVVAIPKLFKNEDEINAFCEDILNKQIKEFTPEIANKIVHVLAISSSVTACQYRVLKGVYGCSTSGDISEKSAKNLSDAGFGKALSRVLLTHSDNVGCVININLLVWQDSHSNVKCAQDLYDAIDSPTGYDGGIFDTLLKIMQRQQNERETIDAGMMMAFYLIKNTQSAKSIMIEKGFLNVLENFDHTWTSFSASLRRALR